jgi:hypothetical protein
MGDEQESNRIGTSLDDDADPVYEDGSPVELPLEPNPTRPDSTLNADA